MTHGTADEAQAAAWQLANRLALTDADVDVLISRLQASSMDEGRLRRTILWALSLRPDRLPLDTIATYATADPDPDVRRTATRSLSTTDSPRVRDVLLRNAADDAEPRNRAESIFFLTVHLDDARSAEAALAGLEREADPDVRSAWVNLLGDRPDELMRVLNDEHEHVGVRQAAAESLIENAHLALAVILDQTTLPATHKQQLSRMYTAGVSRRGKQ